MKKKEMHIAKLSIPAEDNHSNIRTGTLSLYWVLDEIYFSSDDIIEQGAWFFNP